MGWLPLFSLDNPFLRALGIPGKCGLCDQGAEMSRDKRLPFPQPGKCQLFAPPWKVKLLRSHRFCFSCLNHSESEAELFWPWCVSFIKGFAPFLWCSTFCCTEI